jgi:hypothetical protein
MKAGVGAKSWLPYAAMFTAYKQLWVTLWDQPCICSIRNKIDTYVWQSSSTSNVVMSDTEGEDFTSDLMRLAIANAGCKESDIPGPTTDNIPGPTTDNIPDIPRPVTPISPIVIPAASASALTPGPAVPVIVFFFESLFIVCGGDTLCWTLHMVCILWYTMFICDFWGFCSPGPGLHEDDHCHLKAN